MSRLQDTTGCIVYTAGCQTSCTTRFDNRLNEQWLFVQHRCQSGCTTDLTTVLNEQPLFVQPVVKPGCTTSLATGCIHNTTGC